ncbi:hypothetical protein RRG08_036039 [Elysia crispata]|uniref:Uncharacterized protein n=1 Tax=Elysia crispata TaxID=231223 RepID=A0AAE1AM62_9GAST|nr:hypothetical protein RRG08_036039 [Elysia crispata]
MYSTDKLISDRLSRLGQINVRFTRYFIAVEDYGASCQVLLLAPSSYQTFRERSVEELKHDGREALLFTLQNCQVGRTVLVQSGLPRRRQTPTSSKTVKFFSEKFLLTSKSAPSLQDPRHYISVAKINQTTSLTSLQERRELCHIRVESKAGNQRGCQDVTENLIEPLDRSSKERGITHSPRFQESEAGKRKSCGLLLQVRRGLASPTVYRFSSCLSQPGLLFYAFARECDINESSLLFYKWRQL